MAHHPRSNHIEIGDGKKATEMPIANTWQFRRWLTKRCRTRRLARVIEMPIKNNANACRTGVPETRLRALTSLLNVDHLKHATFASRPRSAITKHA
jgi:hypothetical protein